MALDLVDKRTLSRAEPLTDGEESAVRAIADGAGDAAAAATVLAVMSRARAAGRWLRCDCREADGRRPMVAPCRNHRGTDYWRVLGGRHPDHDEGCVFHRTQVRHRLEARWSRPRKAPRGYFAVLHDAAEDRRVSLPHGRPEEETEERRTARRSALSQRLLMLMERARFNRLPEADALGDPAGWLGRLRDSAADIEIAPGRPLRELWFTNERMWHGRAVHARVREAARDWPSGFRAQGFLCVVAWEVDSGGIGTERRGNRIDVASAVGRPVIGRNPVPRPYLFLGLVGERNRRAGYECLAGHAQPIVAASCPVPVDSRYERRAFGTLRAVIRRLGETFPDAAFSLEKPVFDIPTPEGPCLPDFLIRASRNGDEAVFVVEVMGFDRPDYLRGKEVTHPRMATLGTLFMIGADAFDGGGDRLRREGIRITGLIRETLLARWGFRRGIG